MQPAPSRDLTNRRARVPCKICGRMLDIARMRDHLKMEHQIDPAQLETLFVSARREARRSQRSQVP